MEKLELLAPAADFTGLQTVVQYGADAVYVGGDGFSMRAASKGIWGEELKQGVMLAHQNGVKVYITCNTVPSCEEMKRLPAFLEIVSAAGVDALIVADLGVISEARKYAKELALHASTQVGIFNDKTACALYKMGVSRVVLARELSLEEIRTIRENTPRELALECFVHGAACMSYSGRCLLSQYMVGRDANRGACAQPCRWSYHLMEEKRPGEYFPVVENEAGSYILNAKDLCLIDHLGALAQAGVTSFKIEGRAKSQYYAAMITNAYRMALDAYQNGEPLPDWVRAEVDKVSHRHYHTGFLFGKPEDGQHTQSASYQREYDVVALVKGTKNGMLVCTQRNRFSVGELLEIVMPKQPPVPYQVVEIYDGEGEPITVAKHATMEIQLPCEKPIPTGAMIRKKV